MAITVRNETNDDVSINYDNEDITLEPTKYIQIEDLDKLMMDSTIVKIRKGVIKIKGIL